jgi:predicted phage-related endonuclease
MATTTELTTTLTVVDEVAVLDNTNVSYLIKELNDAKRAIKEAEARKDAADKAIRKMMGDALIGTIGGAVRVELVPVERVTVDAKKLQAGWADAYAACKKVSEHHRLYTK